MKKTGFEQVAFRGRFRSYQQKVLDETDNYLDDGRIHIAAAPGSGKTVLGLELIRSLGKPALVLSPTVVIANQWGERFTELFLPDGEALPDYFSENLKDPGLITSITYQALYSAWNKLTAAEAARDAAEADDTDDYDAVEKAPALDFHGFDPVACIRDAGIRTICLDEAHHLKREWQKALEAFIAAVEKDITIIALTATPPYDSTESEWQRYVSLCGEIDTEIFVPELVAQKTLCPHQDYIIFNYPTDREKEVIVSHRQNIENCVDEVLRSGLFAAAAVRCSLVGDILPDQDQLYRYAKEYISLAVCAGNAGLPPSPALVNKLLLGSPLPKYDASQLQRAYAFIAGTPEVFGEELSEQMAAICRRRRLAPRGKLLLDDESRVGKALFSSLGKLESISEIATEEYGELGGKLRLVVLTDYIRKDYLKAVGTEERMDAMGAVPIFETLRRALPAEARIGMLSGSLVIWPLDRLDTVEGIAARYGAGFSYSEIVQKGTPGLALPELPAPPSGQARYAVLRFEGNRRTMIAVLTEAFQQGSVQAIVGTKALLGEGWDSPCINCLIIASFVGSYVLSNQMRGRAIRTDKNDPEKTANIWHLVAIEPGVEIPRSADFELLARRFRMFFGPSYRGGMISNGINRLDIIEPPYDEAGIARINDGMKGLAADRAAMAKTWEDSLGEAPELRISDANFVPKGALAKPMGGGAYGLAKSLGGFALSVGILAALFVLAGGAGITGIVVLCLLGMAASAWAALIYGKRGLRSLRQRFAPETVLRAMAECLHGTLKAQGFIKSPHTRVRAEMFRDGVSIVCALENATSREQKLFSDAVSEMLSPIEDPRYIIVRQEWASHKFDPRWSFAAPSSFTKIAAAHDLAKRVSKRFDRCSAVYTRTESGYRLLNECRVRSFTRLYAAAVLRKMILGR